MRQINFCSDTFEGHLTNPEDSVPSVVQNAPFLDISLSINHETKYYPQVVSFGFVHRTRNGKGGIHETPSL